jgi:catechol 2,3-dioxygenase-like lactoylglutathione lyase family enzyme
MKIRNTSHIAIGVSNMERALHFYRDVLGLRVTLDDPQENPGGMLSRVSGAQRPTRHGVYLRWEDGPDATFVVLSENRPTSGEPLKINQVGIHHFAFWVDDLQETYEKVKAAGVPIVLQPTVFDTVAYGEPSGSKVMTTLFKDPDGTIIQLDQRVP